MGILGGSKANYLIGKNTRSFWFPNFLKWMRSNKSLENLPNDIIMFGEWLNRETLEYDKERLNKFYFIDLGFVSEGKVWLYDYEESLDYLSEWKIKNIEILEPIKKGVVLTEEEIREIVTSTKSKLGANEIEGVVLKDYETQTFAKFLNPKYSEIREQEKTLEKRYINEPRIRKAIKRLKEEKGIPKPTLEDIILEITNDIKEESGIEFSVKALSQVIRMTYKF